MKTMTWHGDRLELIDQTRLPHEVAILACRDAADVARAIKDMVVRGAPAIGVAAAYGVALGALGIKDLPRETFLPRLGELIALIGSSRPSRRRATAQRSPRRSCARPTPCMMKTSPRTGRSGRSASR